MRDSSISTEIGTRIPAIRPIPTATAGTTKAQPALLATSPATQPLAQSEASGFPKRTLVIPAAATPAAAAQSVVLMAATAAPPLFTPAKRIAPETFRPSHPTTASRQPNRTRTALWPGIALGVPSLVYLPRRGPRIQARDSAVRPPTTWIVLPPPASRNPFPMPCWMPRPASHPPPHTQCANSG